MKEFREKDNRPHQIIGQRRAWIYNANDALNGQKKPIL